MAKHLTENVRDIVLLGHRGSGKTSLADALLYEAHAVDRLGRVDDGTSVADTDEDERRHHFSIDTHVLHAEHAGKHLHILDTPGSPDFIGATLEGLAVAETAVIVISATQGVEMSTRKLFQEATDKGLSRVIVINKLDADAIDFASLIPQIQEVFGRQCIPFNVPNAIGEGFNQVLCVLDPISDDAGTFPLDPGSVRSQLIDAVVEADESLTERFLVDGDVSPAELEATIPKALAAGTLIPIFCTSAVKDIGVSELLDALSRHGLSPSYAKRRLASLTANSGDSENVDSGEFRGLVFKVVNDRYVGHLSYIRVISGQLNQNQTIVNLNTGKSIRVGHLLQPEGKSYAQVSEAVAGDIVAVAKIDGLHVGDTMALKGDGPLLPAMGFPAPMYGLAIEAKTRGDEQKIANALHKLAEEDPTVQVQQDQQTHELVLSGVSQLHLDVVQERLKHRFDVDVVAKAPKVPYHETIKIPGEGDYRHKKQSGGRGQFAEVHLRIYPLDRDIKTKEQLEEQFANKSRFEKLRSVHYHPDLNFAFLDHIVGGTIPNQYIPAVEKGCLELMERGPLAGYRMQDIAVEVYFGKEHPVDSSEAAFKIAARLAFKKAVSLAKPVLLEPIVKLEITVPSKYTGAILGDLPTRRAQVENQDSLPGDQALITARAPLSEMSRYAAQLGGITQGQGAYSIELSHYDTVPAQVQAAIVASATAQKDDDE